MQMKIHVYVQVYKLSVKIFTMKHLTQFYLDGTRTSPLTYHRFMLFSKSREREFRNEREPRDKKRENETEEKERRRQEKGDENAHKSDI